MEAFLAQLLNGLSLGSVYLFLVTGFNVMLIVARVVHVSYPHTVVLSMYVAWFALRWSNGTLLVAAIAAIAASAVTTLTLASILSRIAARDRRVDINTTMVVSLAFGLVITEILAQLFNNGFPIAFPDSVVGNEAVVRSTLIHLTSGQVISFVAALLVVAALFLLLYRSRWGRAARAIAEDRAGARLVGVPIFRTRFVSYLIAGTLSGITAVVLAVLIGTASPTLSDTVAIKALAVSIIAGLGNIVGGIAVALTLGVLEAIAQGYIAGSWSNALALIVLLPVLLARPYGIFGSKV